MRKPGGHSGHRLGSARARRPQRDRPNGRPVLPDLTKAQERERVGCPPFTPKQLDRRRLPVDATDPTADDNRSSPEDETAALDPGRRGERTEPEPDRRTLSAR